LVIGVTKLWVPINSVLSGKGEGTQFVAGTAHIRTLSSMAACAAGLEEGQLRLKKNAAHRDSCWRSALR